jgi:Tfp pilus assembly protein PilF
MAQLALLAAACCSASCATLPPCPAQGGPTWRELISPHFRVRSDMDPDDAHETLRRLEELRASILATLWPGAPEPPNRTEVVVLRSRIDFLVYARDPAVPALLWGMRTDRPPLPPLLAFGGTDYRAMGVLSHELAHELSFWFMPIQPPWYAEGIGTFLETIKYDRKAGRVDVGEPSVSRQRGSQGLARVSAASLLGTGREPAGEELARFEDSAWLLMHYLINKRPRDFARLQAELGRLKTTAEAWRAVFPDLPPQKLDFELDAYGRSGGYASGELALRVPAPEVAVRVMTDAEAHAARAQLFETVAAPGVAPDHERATREIAEALAADPSNVDALALRFFWFTRQEARDERAELARRATTAHPHSWLAWLMAASVAPDQRTERTALSRALESDPNQAIALSELARLAAAAGRWQEALAFSTRAMHVGERHWALLSVHMHALAHVGNCHDAAFFVETLQTLAPEKAAAEARRYWYTLRPTCLETALRASQAPELERAGASP